MKPNAVIHNFQERLAASADLKFEAAWVAFYQMLWPNMIAAVRLDKDSKWQRWGVDRIVYLPGGREIKVDEKKRDSAYRDLLIEEWSVGRVIEGDFIGDKSVGRWTKRSVVISSPTLCQREASVSLFPLSFCD